MADNTYFKYKITAFDRETKTLRVAFEYGRWAQINLVLPFPQTIDDVHAIVRAYTLPKEVLDARDVTTPDLDFLADLVDKEFEAERFSFYKASGQHKVDESEKRIAEQEAALAAEQ